MIIHTVTFRLNPSVIASEFLSSARKLAEIPGVEQFEVLNQIGKKNAFTHALSMQFRSQDEYDAYDRHEDHRAFVTNIWMPSVADFLELDYVRSD